MKSKVQDRHRNMNIHFSSEKDTWETPQGFFDELNKKYHFTLDPCCLESSAKCKKFYTPEDDGLAQNWIGETVFMNPPYGDPIQPCKPKCTRKLCAKRGFHSDQYEPGIIDWMAKAYVEGLMPLTTVVCLVPARTDTRWWHDYAMKGRIEFIKGRLKFGGAKTGAPFPSAIVVFGG
jgi:phage N-6-adenine-methyltransferase